jgi:hypothetical protein
MRTTKDVIANSNIPAKLIRAVVRQIVDKESFNDICRGGRDGGFHGFIYTHDTVAFFKRNRAEIVDLVRSMADDMGEDSISFVAGFGCLRGHGESYVSPRDRRTVELRESIARCLFGGRLSDDNDAVANALAWFAGEEVARAFCDE